MGTEAVVRVRAAGANADLRRRRTTALDEETLQEETRPSSSPMAEIPGVSRRVRKLREEMGWTQDNVARRTGVSRDSVGRIERGQLPDPIFLGEFSRAARVSCDWLILGSEEVSVGDEATTSLRALPWPQEGVNDDLPPRVGPVVLLG